MNSSAFFQIGFKPRFLASVCAFGLILIGVGCGSDETRIAEFREKGNQYIEQEQYEEAIIEFRSVLQLDPNDVDAHRNLAEAYFYTDRAREGYWELSETVRLDPDDVDSRIQYTAITMAGGRFDEVLESADAIIAIEPENAAAHRFRGQALLALERTGEAEHHTRKDPGQGERQGNADKGSRTSRPQRAGGLLKTFVDGLQTEADRPP